MKRLCITILATGIASAGAMANEPKPISTEAIYACAEISDNVERLACFDETVGTFQAAEKAGEVTTISRAEVEELEKESFGFSIPSLPKNVLPKFGNSDKDQVEKVEFAVTKIQRVQNDKLRVTLENGQIWQQTDDRRITYSRKLGVESAEIKRAALGSFKMKLDGGRAFRARRIQ